MNTTTHSKRVICFGDSNTWGWVPGKMGKERYDIQTRWPGALQELVGDEFDIIEEALGARTTQFDEPRPELPMRNGLSVLPMALESHAPIDVVIIMLGTGDCKPLFDLPIESIADGVRNLARTAKTKLFLDSETERRVILVAPPIINEDSSFAAKVYAGSTDKTKELVTAYKQISEELDCEFVDSNSVASVDLEDGLHLNETGHQKLAELVCDKLLSPDEGGE